MITNRRSFLKNASAMTLGTVLLPTAMQCTSRIPTKNLSDQIGIQTYTTRNFMNDDPATIFHQLAETGFKNIETASYTTPYYGFKPAELKTLIEDLGMKWIGNHVLGVPMQMLMAAPENPTPEQQKEIDAMASMPAIANLYENTQQLVDEAAEGGLKYLICASTAIRTIEEIHTAVEVFTKAGEACKKAGIQFAYHNHATEWDPIEGTTAYDIIMSETDSELVKMELDLGWVATAKKDAIELFEEYPGRFPLFHLKDFNLTTNTIVTLGKGDIDFKPAFNNAELAGMKYFFYEQDTAQSIEDVQASYKYLTEILQ